MKQSLSFIAIIAMFSFVLAVPVCFADEDAADAPAAESPASNDSQGDSEDSQSLEEMIKALSEPETNKEKSAEELLDEAMMAKISVDKLNDIDKVIDLCNRAIAKGLSKENEQAAKNLIRATLMQRVVVLAEAMRGGRFANPQEIRIIAGIAGKDLETIRESLPKNEMGEPDEQNFEGADIYWYVKYILTVFSTGDEQASASALETAKKLNKDNPARMAQILFVQAMLKDSSKDRLNLLKEASEDDPESETIKRALAKTYGELRMLDDAMKVIEPLIQDDPNNPLYLAIMADYYSKENQPQKCLEALSKLDEIAPGNEGILWQKIKCALELKDMEMLMSLSEQALKNDPKNEQLLLFRANYLAKQKKYDLALKELDQDLFFHENSVEAKTLRAAILCQKDKANFDDARKVVEPILDNPESTEEELRACLVVLHYLDEDNKIVEVLERILKQKPDDEHTLQALAYAYLDVKQYDKVKQTYDTLIEKFPKTAVLFNNYSWLLSTSTVDSVRDGKKSLELALKAAELTEYKEAYILSTLAAAYAETGDFEKARETIQKGIDCCKDETMKQSIQKEADSYKANKPWREEAKSWMDTEE